MRSPGMSGSTSCTKGDLKEYSAEPESASQTTHVPSPVQVTARPQGSGRPTTTSLRWRKVWSLLPESASQTMASSPPDQLSSRDPEGKKRMPRKKAPWPPCSVARTPDDPTMKAEAQLTQTAMW
mmetsp:Transcript_35616/g.101468  ORF Transcript_35616/g.101468 Transcript_35616/m.101468 type:complete len:124 (+) Transcript_35616:697-1068(+)